MNNSNMTKDKEKLDCYLQKLRDLIAKDTIFTKVACVYLMYSIVLVGYTRHLETGSDSGRYLPPAPLFSQATPGVLVNILYSPFGAYHNLLLFQMVVASVAWIIFASAVRKLFRAQLGLVLAIFILGYSLVGSVVSWQWWALTEGLTMSLFVLWITTFVWLCNAVERTKKTQIIVVQIIIGLLLVLTRPQLFLLIGPIQLFFTVRFRPEKARKVLIVMMLSLLVATTVWSGMRLAQVANNSRLQLWYAENNLVTKPGYLDFAIDNGVNCRTLLDATVSIVDFSTARPNLPALCPKDISWLSSKSASWSQWFLDRPISVILEFRTFLLKAEAVKISPQRNPLPSTWNDLFLPSSFPVISSMFFLMLLSSLHYVVRGVKIRIHIRPLLLSLFIFISAIFYLFVMWASDGIELERHMVPVLTMFPIAGFLFPHLLVWKFTKDEA